MEILQLKYFISAAEMSSFTAAAKKYGVPVSDISQTIKRLERELETQLFTRSANRVTLSAQGRVFLEGVRRSMTELDGACSRIRELSGGVCGEIRLLILANRRVVTDAIEQFRSLHPDVTFNLSHSPHDGGDFDIIISDERPKNGVYEENVLVEEEMLLAVSEQCIPEDFDVSAPSLSAFRDSRFITMPEQSSHCRITKALCKSFGFTPNIGIMCDDPYYIRKYVEMGLGVTLVPAFSWKGQFSEGTPMFRIGDFRRTTYLFNLPKSVLPYAAREFLPILESAFGDDE